jgi:Leucine-rich repeat (LRR) protein
LTAAATSVILAFRLQNFGLDIISFHGVALSSFISDKILVSLIYFSSNKMTEHRNYDALVQDINLENITSTEHNADILRRLRDGDPEWNKELYIVSDEIGGDIGEFIVRMGDDWGWMGYFIGVSEVLQKLTIDYLPGDGEQIDAFMRGITHNQSIRELRINRDLGDQGFKKLGSFLQNNSSLTRLRFEGFDIGRDCAHDIAMALEQCRHNSLSRFDLLQTNISDEGFIEIATALSAQSQLERLNLYRNNIGREGCVALGNTIGTWQVSNLEFLDVSYNSIDDQGLQALVAGMATCYNIDTVDLSNNGSITSAGLRCMSPLFQSESCSLKKLVVHDINFGDEGAMALADGLKGNKSLERLRFISISAGVTDVGWAAFSKLLCDTSSINNTYLSNHTLEMIGNSYAIHPHPDIKQYLAWNEYQGHPAIHKILKSHTDFDMEPFLQWKLKCLPVIVDWFERAKPFLDQDEIEQTLEIEQSFESRKLSSVYNFVRGMPMLVIDSYQSHEKTRRRSRKRRLDGEAK